MRSVDRAWKAVLSWLDEPEPSARGFRSLLDACEVESSAALSRLPLEEELGHLELWLLEQLQAEPEESKGRPLWFRLRPQMWQERPDGGELVLECASESRFAPATEFSEPIARAGCTTPSAVLQTLLHAAGRAREDHQRELLEGPLAVGAIAWSAQRIVERVASPLLYGDFDRRLVLVGHDGGPALSLGHCAADAWYRDAVVLLSDR